MPPKSTTKVQPSAKSAAGGKSRAGTAAKKGTTTAATSNGGAKKDNNAVKEQEVKDEAVKHDNDEYNMYDIDGHRIKSPEPTTRWGKFKKKCRDAWKKSFLFKKKQRFHEWNRERCEKKRYLDFSFHFLFILTQRLAFRICNYSDWQ